MLAQVEPTHNNFVELAHYLVHGRTRPTHPNRVAWIRTQNLLTDDPTKVAEIMVATASRSKRCQNAAYHMSINWREDENPSPEIMQEIAFKTLELAGLAEHQALAMGHGDKKHAHLHMMINRVHPETGRAWSTSHDYARFDRIMKLLADEHGFLYVPGHRFEPELTDDIPKQPKRRARRAAAKGANTNRIQGSNADARELGSYLSDDIDRATSWDDIEAALADYGLSLEAKGQGLVAGNAQGYFKFSRLGLSLSANALARKFGRRFKPRDRPPRRSRSGTQGHRPHPFTVGEVDIARAIGTRANLRSAVQEAVGKRKARIAKAPLMTQLLEDLKETLKATTSLTPARRPPKPRKRAARPQPGHQRPQARGR